MKTSSPRTVTSPWAPTRPNVPVLKIFRREISNPAKTSKPLSNTDNSPAHLVPSSTVVYRLYRSVAPPRISAGLFSLINRLGSNARARFSRRLRYAGKPLLRRTATRTGEDVMSQVSLRASPLRGHGLVDSVTQCITRTLFGQKGSGTSRVHPLTHIWRGQHR